MQMNIDRHIPNALYGCLVAAVIFLSGCSWQHMPPGYSEYLAGARHLPSSGIFLQGTSIVHEFVISQKNKEQRFISQTEFGPSGLSMVALTAFGQKLFELQYKNNSLTITKTPFLPRSLDPEKIFSDILMIFWPFEAIRDAYIHSNIQPRETETIPAERTFEFGDKHMVEIRYQSGITIDSNVSYVDLQKNYSMTIAVISKTPIDL